jgi:hypothetical protein
VGIADLPFHERPVLELLNFEDDRHEVQQDYAGYGWARVPRIWLGETMSYENTSVDDILVLALHSCDIGEELPDDIELEFELPGAEPVTVLASKFLEIWLPKLPHASAIVLAMCNPYGAALKKPSHMTSPIYYATGDVESWRDLEQRGRLELLSTGSWARLAA